ncbi:hypothetical protein Lgee_1014 [Legionella geestiana]|uniref:Uncharacterized protein n=1 Tax=Legionella geestiana TaxID=45065 RepID=Q49J08_9GAMM|nr:hypothetical protein [Legionella geestiana]AAX56268.1 unknown [Legionella geestiana]KTD00619.1 hypothetical protein Lgee_1014 [Legionella geestiana]QBS12674.1 hypothetical protein E4T54_07915 [Legionella geestiana]STX54862.1 Uncharacterised protein [Legionella geestiana]
MATFFKPEKGKNAGVDADVVADYARQFHGLRDTLLAAAVRAPDAYKTQALKAMEPGVRAFGSAQDNILDNGPSLGA